MRTGGGAGQRWTALTGHLDLLGHKLHTQGPVSTGLPHSASYTHTGTSQHWTASQCIIHRDQSALDCFTVHHTHTQGPVSTGLPHSASYTGTSQHWTASQCIIHRDQSALDCLTVHHTHIQVLVGGGNKWW